MWIGPYPFLGFYIQSIFELVIGFENSITKIPFFQSLSQKY